MVSEFVFCVILGGSGGLLILMVLLVWCGLCLVQISVVFVVDQLVDLMFFFCVFGVILIYVFSYLLSLNMELSLIFSVVFLVGLFVGVVMLICYLYQVICFNGWVLVWFGVLLCKCLYWGCKILYFCIVLYDSLCLLK